MGSGDVDFPPLTLVYRTRGIPLLYLELIRTRSDNLSPSVPGVLCGGVFFILPSSLRGCFRGAVTLYTVQPFC